jgi:hypothetical protein
LDLFDIEAVEKATYKLERAVRERDRLARHLASLVRNEGAA